MRKLLDDAIAAEAGTKNDDSCGGVFLGMIGDGNQPTSHPKKETHILTPPPPKLLGF